MSTQRALNKKVHEELLAKGELNPKYTRKHNKAKRSIDMYRTKGTNKSRHRAPFSATYLIPDKNSVVLHKLGFVPKKTKLTVKIKKLYKRFSAQECKKRPNKKSADRIQLNHIDKIIELCFKAQKPLTYVESVLTKFVKRAKQLDFIFDASNYLKLQYNQHH